MTNTILIATKNHHKIQEFQTIFHNKKVISLSDLGFDGDIPETAETFEGNAVLKAEYIAKKYGISTVADDSGLEVDALGGLPGVRSARYSGEKATDEENIQKLLKELENIPPEKRTARFVCVICKADPNGKTQFVRGECEGIILREKRGDGTFGYDPIFYYPPLKKTFAQLSQAEKNAVSHRGAAAKEFVNRILVENNKKT